MDGTYYDFKAIKSARKEKYTQEEFRKLLDVEVVTLSRMENGHIGSYELIIKACQLLGLDSKDIFYSSNEISITS